MAALILVQASAFFFLGPSSSGGIAPPLREPGICGSGASSVGGPPWSRRKLASASFPKSPSSLTAAGI
jgi:hypothetical protein